MANILINGLKSKAGGGKNILDNYLNQLHLTNQTHTFYVLTPDQKGYEIYAKNNVILVDVKEVFKKNILFLALYFLELPILLRKLKIDLIFNFGDVIIPTKTDQIYFFDWAYAVYQEEYIWNRMSFKDLLVRKIKVFLIGKYIGKVKLTICQTQNMAKRLVSHYKLQNIVVVPTPVGIEFNNAELSYQFNLPKEKIKFLFPASFSSHKNFDILIPLGEQIKKSKLPYVIVLTIDKVAAKGFFEEIEKKKIDCIINVGKLPGTLMPTLYKQCDALFLPTLLESFGIPYIEAMAYEKPIITSDLDFAREVCEKLAYYFDPFDAASILKAMQGAFNNENQRIERINLGKAKVNSLPDWENVFLEFQKYIELTINQNKVC